MKWVLIILLFLGACSGPGPEAYVFRPKQQLRIKRRADLKSALQSGYWMVEPSETPAWYDFREDNQCTFNWIDPELGVFREVYCIWFLHDRENKKRSRLDLVIPILSAVVFSDTVTLDGDVVRLKGKPDILRHTDTYPVSSLPGN